MANANTIVIRMRSARAAAAVDEFFSDIEARRELEAAAAREEFLVDTPMGTMSAQEARERHIPIWGVTRL